MTDIEGIYNEFTARCKIKADAVGNSLITEKPGDEALANEVMSTFAKLPVLIAMTQSVHVCTCDYVDCPQTVLRHYLACLAMVSMEATGLPGLSGQSMSARVISSLAVADELIAAAVASIPTPNPAVGES